MVMLITLLFRRPTHIHTIKPPLWEISEVIKGNDKLIFDIIANTIMLLPLGIFIPLWLKRSDIHKKVVLMAFLVSLSIEIIQLITTRGYFEIDDLFHNTLGGFIGSFIGCPLAGWLCSEDKRKKEK